MHTFAGTEECYIGLPVEHSHRVARMSPAGLLDALAHMLASWQTLKTFISFTLFGFGQCRVYAKSAVAPHYTSHSSHMCNILVEHCC